MTEQQRDNSQILAVSVDNAEYLQKMIDRIEMEDGIVPDFPLLSDPDHQVIDRYGLFNPHERRGRPVPYPATYMIDKQGRVRWKVIEINYRVRRSNEDIQRVLAELQ